MNIIVLRGRSAIDKEKHHKQKVKKEKKAIKKHATDSEKKNLVFKARFQNYKIKTHV